MSEATPQLARADLERLLVHADWLHALARRLVGGAAADDVVQETLIAAMRSPPDAERPPRPWLGRVLRNVARMRHRGESRRARREDVVAVEAAPPRDSPAEAVQRLETHRALCDVVLALDEPYRSTLVMHYYDGRSLADLARAGGVPEATVRWRHRHALDLIRARLDERSGGDRRTWLAALAPLAGPESTAVLKGLAVKKIVAIVAAIVVALFVTWRLVPRGSEPEAAAAVEEAAPSVRLSFHRPAAVADTTGAGRIHGRVRGPAGAVRAMLISTDGGAHAERTVDGDRVFDFLAVKPGTYCIVVAGVGLGASACEIAVRAGETVERDLDLALRTARLGGTISDAGGGPIPGGLVVAQRMPAGTAAAAVRGDAAGAYELSLAPGYYEIAASADGYTPARHALEVRAQQRLDVRLHPGSTIAGRVLDPDGKPATGAAVAAGGRSATAGSDGRFTLDGITPGRHDVFATHGELAAAREDIAVAFGGTAEVELVLAASRAAIVGRVVDGNDRPVAGARVEAEGPLSRRATTAADGTFRIGGLVAGWYDVAAIADDFVRGLVPAIVGPDGASTITLTLARGVTVRGVVRTSRGEPVAGAAVATSGSNLNDRRLDVTTDASGAFRVGPLPTGQARISAHHRDHGVTEIVHLDVPAGASPTADLVFGATASITGTVRHDDGTPAAGAQIEVTPGDTPARWVIAADREGRFAIDALPAGAYMIEAHPLLNASRQATGSMKGFLRIELEAGAKRTLELEVPGGRERVRGRIVDGAGQPIGGAGVWAERVWEGAISPATEVQAYSQPDGAFELDDLPRGTYTVYARHSDGRTGQTGKVASGATNVSVVIRGGARVAGRVVDRTGRPATTFRLQWHWLSRVAKSGQVSSSASRVVHHANGEFVLDHLEPTSEFVIGVETSDGSTGSLEAVPLVAGEARAGVEIKVVGLGTVRGRLVRKDNGAPLLGHTVWFPLVGMRGVNPVDGEGRFVAQVPAGTYDHINIQSSSMGYPDIPVAYTVEPGRTVDLGDLVIAPR